MRCDSHKDYLEETGAMTMSKHTPGPFEVSELHEGEGYDILVERDGEGNGWHEIAMHIEKKADADLFAAAPNMLRTLEAVRVIAQNIHEQKTKVAILSRIDAAISKAKKDV